MKKLIPLALAALCLQPLAQAITPASAVTPELKRIAAPELSTAIMREVVIPNLATLKQEAERLKSSTAQLCKASNEQQLSTARKSYIDTLLAWRKIEIAPIGPTNNVNNGRVFEALAAPLNKLTEQAKTTPDRAMVDGEAFHYGIQLPDGTIGLPAIGAFLFSGSPAETLAVLQKDKNCAYLQWQTQVVMQQVTTQQYEWFGLSRGIEYDVSYPGQFVVEYLNQIILGVSSIRTSKLGADSKNWQDAKSQSTATGIQANVQGLILLLEGSNGGTGLDDYLISRDKAALWNKVAMQLKDLQSAADLLESSTNAKNIAKVNTAADQLASTLKTEVAPALNIRIGKK
nr:imelysin family protein [uncultured Deefgea sp.]